MSVKAKFVVTEIRRGHQGEDAYCEVILSPASTPVSSGALEPIRPVDDIQVKGQPPTGWHPQYSLPIRFRDGAESFEFDLGDTVEVTFTSLRTK